MDFDAKRILVCLRYGIGDLVMETPVLQALRVGVPEARITALGAEPATELLAADPRVDEVASYQGWGLAHRWDPGGAETRSAIARWLDAHDFDLFLDVHHAPPVVGEVVWSRGVRSLEADEGAESRAVEEGRDGVSAIKAAVWAGWGLPVSERLRPKLHLSWEARVFADDFLEVHGHPASPIALSPVASTPLKRWPPGRFAQLADQLVQSEPGSLLLFRGPQRAVAEEVRAQMRQRERVVEVGAIHLQRTAALLARCRALVCNDTGLMHLGAAVGTPTVGIFGPTAPTVYRPPAPHALAVGGTGFDCPYRNTASLHPPGCFAEGRCLVAEHGCIERVDVDSVVAALRRALREAPPARTIPAFG